MRAEPAPPDVSVVLATYDRAPCVADAVESALAQVGTSLEVVVVDDGSRDGTAVLLEERFGNEPRVRVFARPHEGVASARNAGLAVARGEFLAFLDSDDLLLPGAIASQVRALGARPDAQMAIGDAWVEHAAPRGRERLGADPSYRPATSLAAVFEGGWAMLPTLLFRTSVARALGFRREYPVAEDTEFQLRFFAAGYRCVENPDPVAVVRRDGVARGAAPLSEDGLGRALARLRMMREHRAVAPDPEAYRRVELHLCRRLAKELVANDRPAEARSPAWTWARRRPWRLRPWLSLARAWLARGASLERAP
jgi:glycosyltransferase involved in cell wall biosynthesis